MSKIRSSAIYRKSRRLNPYFANYESDNMDTTNIDAVAPTISTDVLSTITVNNQENNEINVNNIKYNESFQKLTTSKQNEVLLNEIRESREENKKYFSILTSLLTTVNKHAEIINQHEAFIQEQWARIEDLEKRLEYFENNGKSADIVIKGLPLNCSLDYWSITEKLLAKIGFEGHPKSVIYATRHFPAYKNKEGTEVSQCFVISVINERILTKILQLRKEAGVITYKDLFSAEEINDLPPDSQIFISKLLEPTLFKLLSATIKQAKPLGYKYIWSSKNCVKIRKDEKSQIYDVFDVNDLRFIK